jgi:hypothetical protein
LEIPVGNLSGGDQENLSGHAGECQTSPRKERLSAEELSPSASLQCPDGAGKNRLLECRGLSRERVPAWTDRTSFSADKEKLNCPQKVD